MYSCSVFAMRGKHSFGLVYCMAEKWRLIHRSKKMLEITRPIRYVFSFFYCRFFGFEHLFRVDLLMVGSFQGLLKMIDIPGHERLRMKFWDQYKSSARALIFVVDGLTFQKDLRDVAE